jgi:hypothetical protein
MTSSSEILGKLYLMLLLTVRLNSTGYCDTTPN